MSKALLDNEIDESDEDASRHKDQKLPISIIKALEKAEFTSMADDEEPETFGEAARVTFKKEKPKKKFSTIGSVKRFVTMRKATRDFDLQYREIEKGMKRRVNSIVKDAKEKSHAELAP